MTKEERKEYNKKYQQRNKEKLKKQSKEYYEENKEKIKEEHKEYRERNKEKVKESTKQYRERNKEKIKQKNKKHNKEYRKTPPGKKTRTISKWKGYGLKETREKMEELYEIYTTIKLCEACDIELTRNGNWSATDVCLDHCHTTGRFRLMLCRSCNCNDNWKKYFC